MDSGWRKDFQKKWNIRRFELCQTCKTVAEEMVSLRIEIQSHTWWNPLRQREHDVTCVASAFQKHLPSISTGFVLRPMQTLQNCIPKNVSFPSPTRDFTSVPAFLLFWPKDILSAKLSSNSSCVPSSPQTFFSTKFFSVFFLPLDQTCLYKICFSIWC